MSDSSGNDSNQGTLAAPLKTLAAAAARGPFGPGSSIALKAGDTWINQTLAVPSGTRGRYAENVWDSTYASTLATQQAAYIAGTATPPLSLPTFAQAKTARLNAGALDAEATADATEYCRRLAVTDAVIAAHTAANSATDAANWWVTIGRYGTGANPIIDGAVAGVNTLQFGIDLSGADTHYRGGVKIDNVDVRNCLVAGIRAETGVANSQRGLWVTPGTKVSDITGVAFNGTTHTLNTPIPGYNHFTALGIDVVGVRNACLDGVTITNTDTPYFMIFGDEGLARNVTTSHSYYLHPYFGEFAARCVCSGGLSEFMCDIGIASGRAGMFTAITTDCVIFSGLELSNNRGNGLDFEGHLRGATLFACNVHHSESAAFLEFTNTGQNQGTMIVGCSFSNNPTCTTCDAGVPNLMQTGGGAVITENKMLWLYNTVVKKSGHVNLFAGGDHTTPTDDITVWVTQGVFDATNTVT